MKTNNTPGGIQYGHREIVEKIQMMIRQDKLKPGDRLPAERNLAAAFKVSRNSVREAIRTLAEKGVLISRRGDGTYVAETETATLVEGLARAVQSRHRRLRDIFDFRRLLEPEIAARAAGSISREDLEFLKLTVFEQERCLLSDGNDNEPDRAFHLALARSTGNRVLVEVLHILEGIFSETRSAHLKSLRRQRVSTRAHIRIIDALERGDAAEARRAMRDHLDDVETVVFASTDETDRHANRPYNGKK